MGTRGNCLSSDVIGLDWFWTSETLLSREERKEAKSAKFFILCAFCISAFFAQFRRLMLIETEPGGIRTHDPAIKSRMLYQLSYELDIPRPCRLWG
jgi:hypothetical protein